jgi:hypothetical protein
MIPASAYANGASSYIFDPAVMLGARASDRLDDGMSVAPGLLQATSRPVVPGEAVFFATPTTSIGLNAFAPVYEITATTPASTAGSFAGILVNDIWFGRNDEPLKSHIDTTPAPIVTARPGTMVPRAVELEWWVPVDFLTPNPGINSPLAVVTAAGASQGWFSTPGAGKLAIPATALVFTGRFNVVGGRGYAAVRFPVRLSD